MSDNPHEDLAQWYARKIADAVAAEREACARVVENWNAPDLMPERWPKDFRDGVRWAIAHLPLAIRARSTNQE